MENSLVNQSQIESDKIMAYLETMNLANNLTPQQKQQFIEICGAFGLNPFKREIYASKYGDNFSIIVGYETYIKRAERSGHLSGWNVTTDGTINPSNIAQSQIKATVTIYRKDWAHPFVHEVWFSEYCQKTKDGYPTKFWKDKPYTMLKKVAISQGFRLCFSDELGGMPYTSEEIGTDTIDTSYVQIEQSPVQQNKQIVQAELPIEIPSEPKKKGKKEVKENVVTETLRGSVWDEAMVRIQLCDSIDELRSVYYDYKQYHTDEQFVNEFSKRKKLIEVDPK